VQALAPRELSQLRRRMGYLFQSGALINWLNVADNVGLPLVETLRLPEAEIRTRVDKALDMVGLAGTHKLMPDELSGGMRKRVGLARSLVSEPEILLYDEPTTGLDPVTSSAIGQLIRQAQEELGTSSVVVTHDLPLARTVGQRIAFLDRGCFRFLGTWDEAERADDPVLRGFLDGNPEIDDVV
jgi:phospholipid/cholesterol/gamma-HCH transport system ATP-binding protein